MANTFPSLPRRRIFARVRGCPHSWTRLCQEFAHEQPKPHQGTFTWGLSTTEDEVFCRGRRAARQGERRVDVEGRYPTGKDAHLQNAVLRGFDAEKNRRERQRRSRAYAPSQGVTAARPPATC